MTTVLLTVSIFALVMLAMAIGVILRRPCLRGSCGGPEVLDASGESLTCATCPNRKKRQAAAARSGLPVVQSES
ncbi:MAG: Na(+)-translocating NADH-quinone reductase subunit E [Acidobacteriota bacterium]